MSDISDFHHGEYEDGCFLGCCAMLSGRRLLTFQRFFLRPSSRRCPTAGTSETSVEFYKTTRQNNTKDSYVHKLYCSLNNIRMGGSRNIRWTRNMARIITLHEMRRLNGKMISLTVGLKACVWKHDRLFVLHFSVFCNLLGQRRSIRRWLPTIFTISCHLL
jgi:hypothetical protein